MTEQLAAAFEEASHLSADDQDALAAVIRREIDADRRWENLFARPASHELLSKLADEALAEHRTGRTRKLDVRDL